MQTQINDAKALIQHAEHEPNWVPFQQAFSNTRSINNLDSARTCPSLRVVTEALVRYLWQQEELPIIRWTELTGPRVEKVRYGLARLFGSSTEEIAIVRNSTEALQTLLLGIPLNAGDEVVTTSQDYGSMLAALEHRQNRDGIVVTHLDIPPAADSPEEIVTAFENAIKDRTRLFLISHMINLTGQILPIKQICNIAHARGIEVVVDGAQSFGHLDFKQADLDCDYFGTSLHKYLYAPRGTGMLYIRKDRIKNITPLMGGAIASASENIRKFESVGIESTPRVLAIGEALAFHDMVGPSAKQARLFYLKKRWMDRLGQIPNIIFNTIPESDVSCGIGNFRIEGIPSGDLRSYLWDHHKIEVQNLGQFGSTIRVSANLYTTLQEIDQFCEVIEQVSINGLT